MFRRVKRRIIGVLTFVDCLVPPIGIAMGMCVLVIAIINTYEVVTRYIFLRPTDWTLEVSQYLLIVIVFLTAGYAALADMHVKVDVILDRVSSRKRTTLLICATFLSLFFWSFLAWSNSMLTERAVTLNWRMSTTLGSPVAPAMSLMVVGSVIMCWQLVSKLYHYFVSLSKIQEPKVKEEVHEAKGRI